MYEKIHIINGDINHLSNVYTWCCRQWPCKEEWNVFYEVFNWKTGDFTAKYKFTDKEKSVMFLLTWGSKQETK